MTDPQVNDSDEHLTVLAKDEEKFNTFAVGPLPLGDTASPVE